MKQILLLALVMGFSLCIFAQDRAVLPKAKRDIAVKMPAKQIKDVGNNTTNFVPGMKDVSLPEENEIGTTWYDLQTNSSTQNRIYFYDDGTVGATWNMGFSASTFPDRGTGYNYFDGNVWGDPPTVRIEDTKTGWPSYFPYGENGEAFVCHHMTAGLLYGIREQKGTGEWTTAIQAGPAGAVDISWPRGVTTGINNEIMHFISVTWVAYNGQDNAFLYSRSSDGGQTWEIENHFFEELGPDYYTNFGGDVYEFAEPKNGTLVFLAGDNWTDLLLMKSLDGGDTWTKTVIWENPYPLHVTGQPTDTFYCADGSHHLAIDNSGVTHVVFGINRAVADAAGEYWFPLVDGIGYWNENRPSFSSDLDALCPYDDCSYTELEEDYSLIGWAQDLNNNGTWDILGEVGTYYIGPSSMPQIIIDDNNEIYFVFASVTESYNNNIQDYRHLWARYSPNGDFWGPFVHLTSDIVHIFDECVFPSVAPGSDEYFHLIYQTDIEPGLAERGDEDPYGLNITRYMKVLKSDLQVGIKKNHDIISDSKVSQNYPNPFMGSTTVYVLLDKPASLTLEVSNLTGQVVYSLPEKQYPAGKAELTIHASGLNSGIYFYTIRSGDASVTKKMMVE
jgi:hypothetical protein